MIGVDVQPHRLVPFRCGVVGRHGAQGFRQHHADATVQQPKWLPGAVVYGYAARQIVRPQLRNLNPQMLYGRIGGACIQLRQRHRFTPD